MDTCVIGEVKLFAGRRGAGLPAKGTLLSINDYPSLYSVLGNRFGGDGFTTFALPDLRAAVPRNGQYGGGASLMYYVCTDGLYPSQY